MTSFSLQIAPAAEHDIRQAFMWYQERNALAAHAFRAEVFDTIERTGESPLARAADDEGNRFRVVHRFPYSVFYEVHASSVTILAIAHHRRAPSYWK